MSEKKINFSKIREFVMHLPREMDSENLRSHTIIRKYPKLKHMISDIPLSELL